MVLPGLIGYLIDNWLGTRAVFTVLGFGGGITYGIWNLIHMSRPQATQVGPKDRVTDSGDQIPQRRSENRTPGSAGQRTERIEENGENRPEDNEPRK